MLALAAPLCASDSSLSTCSTTAREQPAAALRRLNRARWSGKLSLELAEGTTHVWLSAGRVAWAERSSQGRKLDAVLADLLAVERSAVRGMAQGWRARRVSWIDALLSEHALTLEQIRHLLLEHICEALSPLTVSRACGLGLCALPEAEPIYDSRLTFAPEEVLRRPDASEPESLQQLARRVYGALGVDVVAHGRAAGFSAEQAEDTRLLEAADALLFTPQDNTTLTILRGANGTWAGMRSAMEPGAASTWLAFDPEVALGGVFMGLSALFPRSPGLRVVPAAAPLKAVPSLFPGASERVGYRALLSEALALGDGGLAAYVFERDAVCWASAAKSIGDPSAVLDRLGRANSVLDLCGAANQSSCEARGLASFVLLAGPSGFHVGARVAGPGRLSLFLSFSSDASYGQSIAALSVGVAALSKRLASAGQRS